MARGTAVAVTPGQAKWIVERLIATKRISADDVRGVMADMNTEIGDLERRLASLREAAGHALVASPAPRSEARVPKLWTSPLRMRCGEGFPASAWTIVLQTSDTGTHLNRTQVLSCGEAILPRVGTCFQEDTWTYS
jgi:hypothetical protein